MTPKISIIIPVYNSERFLTKCLDSVFEQDLSAEDYEVIVINDGSTDGSKEIIELFEKNHPNLVFIDQANQGVSVARNAGLNLAKGEYITFVDSDDEIYENSLQIIVEKLFAERLDIFYPHIETFNEKGERLGEMSFSSLPNVVKIGFLQERRTFTPTFYNQKLLQGIRFNREISFGEDTVFNTKAQARAQRVSFLGIKYYKYTLRENSLSKQGNSTKTFVGFVTAIEELRTFQNKHFSANTNAEQYFDQVYSIFITRMVELNVIPGWNRANYNQLKSLLKREKLAYLLDAFAIKYPFVNVSFDAFKTYQKYLAFKSKIYKLFHRA